MIRIFVLVQAIRALFELIKRKRKVRIYRLLIIINRLCYTLYIVDIDLDLS